MSDYPKVRWHRLTGSDSIATVFRDAADEARYDYERAWSKRMRNVSLRDAGNYLAQFNNQNFGAQSFGLGLLSSLFGNIL